MFHGGFMECARKRTGQTGRSVNARKNLMFVSRSIRHIKDYINMHKLQRTARDLYEHLPSGQKNKADLEVSSTLGCDTTLHILRLSYAGRDWNMGFKNISFSRVSIQWRWEQGYSDVSQAIEISGWLAEVSSDTSLVVHEIIPCATECDAKK